MKVDQPYLEQAIRGDQNALCLAFAWADTPQGSHYWFHQSTRKGGITTHAKKLMRKFRTCK